MEKRNLEQRCAIKFCVQFNENATETYEKLRRSYRGHAVARTQVFRWYKAFLDSRERVEDESRCGRHCTSKMDENLTKVRDLVRSDRRLTEWSVVCWIWIAKTVHDSEKGFIVSGQRLRTLDAASRQCSLSHFHLREGIFGQKVVSVLPQPPNSPDLSPCDFFLFPKLKFHLKGRHFGNVDNIQKVVTDQLRALQHADFQHCYREWEQRLRWCVASQGNNFEGDNVDL